MMALALMLVHRLAHLAWVGGVMVVMLAATDTLESQLFFWPDRSSFTNFAGAEDVWIPSTDGVVLHGWFLAARQPDGSPADRQPGPGILFVHGNAGNIAIHYWLCNFLQDAGFNVLVFDYRSFGRSTDTQRPLLRAQLYDDTSAALDALRARPEVDPDRVGIYGHSLGAVLGLAVAADRPEVRAVAEVSGFATWRGIARGKLGWLGGWMIRDGLDARDSAGRLGDRPLLILHGQRDKTIPLVDAYKIQRAARAGGVRVELHEIADAFHHNLLMTDQPTRGLLIAFFARELGESRPSAAQDPP